MEISILTQPCSHVGAWYVIFRHACGVVLGENLGWLHIGEYLPCRGWWSWEVSCFYHKMNNSGYFWLLTAGLTFTYVVSWCSLFLGMCTKGTRGWVLINTLDWCLVNAPLTLNRHLSRQLVDSQLIFDWWIWVNWHLGNYEPTVDQLWQSHLVHFQF